MSGFSQSLNKGVPVSSPISLKYVDLINIVDDKDLLQEIIDNHFQTFFESIKDYGYEGIIEYFYTMSVDIDPNTLKKEIYMSVSGYFSTLAVNLGCVSLNKRIEDHLLTYGEFEEKLMPEFNERLKFLKEQKTPQKLKANFPFLYAKYQKIENNSNKARQNLANLARMPKVQRDMFLKNLKSKYPEVDHLEELKLASSFTFNKFIEVCSKDLEILMDNCKNLVDYMFSHPIDFSRLEEYDHNKLELYIVNCYLNMAEQVEDDLKQNYLYYVSSYFYEHKDLIDSDLSLKINDMKGERFSYLFKVDDVTITPQLLYKRYCDLLVNNPKLRDINFAHTDFTGMNLKEVEEFMNEYISDLSAQWEFLPNDVKKTDSVIIDKIRNSGSGLSEDERRKHQENLIKLYMEKKELYDSSDPYRRVLGKDTFEGYIGYFYSNGRVILDKLYDNIETGKLANGSAIYAMNINDFYELSKLSKSEIIKNKLCNRYVHRGDWAKRILDNEINVGRENDPSRVVNELIDDGEFVTPPAGPR